MTAANMASRRAYRRAHPHLESPESRKKSNRKYRIASCGLTQDDFNLFLKMQGYACGMCRELFAEGQLIHVDHDHGCCPVKNRSCGKCVRGLLCHGVQHCTGPHRTPVCDSSRVPGRAAPVGGTPSMKAQAGAVA